MKNLTIGKIKGLQQIANPDGILIMCAIDHRGSLRSMIDEESPGEVDYKEMVERKLELCSSLAKHASAVLLDPIFVLLNASIAVSCQRVLAFWLV